MSEFSFYFSYTRTNFRHVFFILAHPVCCFYFLKIRLENRKNIFFVLLKKMKAGLRWAMVIVNLIFLYFYYFFIFGVLGCFLTSPMTSSEGTSGNGPKVLEVLQLLETSTPLWHLLKMWGQFDVRCTLRVILYHWEIKKSFGGNSRSCNFGSNGPIYIFCVIFFVHCFVFVFFLSLVFFVCFFFNKKVVFFSFNFFDWQRWATI